MKKRKLYIIQSKSQASHYFRKFSKEENTVLALSVGAMSFLESRKIKYITTNYFIPMKEEAKQKIYIENKFFNFFDLLDKELVKISSKLNHTAYCLRFHYTHSICLLHYANQLAKSIIDSDFDTIYFYKRKTLIKYIYKFRLHPTNTMTTVLLSFKDKKNIKLLSMMPNCQEAFEDLNHFLRSKIWPYLRPFVKRNINNKTTKRYQKGYKPFYLMLGGEYEWPRFVANQNSIEAERIVINQFIFPLKNSLRKKIKATFVKLIAKEFYLDALLVSRFLKPLIDESVADLVNIINRFDEFNKLIEKYTGIITSVVSDPIDVYLCLLFINNKKPVYLWQHGSGGTETDNLLSDYCELLVCSTFLSYSEAVSRGYKKQLTVYSSDFKSPNFISVGSVHKKSVKQTLVNSRLVTLASGKYWGIPRLLWPNEDPDIRLFNIQKTFIKIAHDYKKNYQFMIKANNTSHHNRLPFESNSFIDIEYRKSFTEVLLNSSVIVLDTPATTLLEASNTNLPIFAILGRAEYTAEFLDVSAKRICWCKDYSDFSIKLRQYLDTGYYPADMFNQDFRDMYLGPETQKEVWRKVERILK